MEITNGNSSKFVFSTVAILRRRISTKTPLASVRYEANIQLWLVLFKDKLMMSLFYKRCLHELQTSTSLSVQLSFYSSGTGVWPVQMLMW